MSYFCAVCNGLQEKVEQCRRCGQKTEDCGRFNDYLGPYSPYRDIEDISLTNGFPDLSSRFCVHVVYCAACRHSFPAFIKEQWGILNP